MCRLSGGGRGPWKWFRSRLRNQQTISKSISKLVSEENYDLDFDFESWLRFRFRFRFEPDLDFDFEFERWLRFRFQFRPDLDFDTNILFGTRFRFNFNFCCFIVQYSVCAKFNIQHFWAKIAELSKSNKVQMTVIFVKKNLMHDVIFLCARRLDNSLSKNGNKMTAHVCFSFNM